MSQNETYYCGWVDSLTQNKSEGTVTPCFDVEAVFDSCGPLIFVRVNFHFFTTDDCLGSVWGQYPAGGIGSGGFSGQSEAYDIAESLLEEANSRLEDNDPQWQAPGYPSEHCIPIRYVLSGVYIHCSQSSQTGGGDDTPDLQTAFGVNTESEINVYVAEYPGVGTGIAFDKFVNIDAVTYGNLNHEIGHVFNLMHTWIDDGCDDTPKLTHNWDKDCDGLLENNSGWTDETNLQCWSHMDTNHWFDANQNSVHDCLEVPPCTPNPCCDWANVNNNVMAYNAYQSAYTNCQITRMLTDLSENYCAFFTMGDCPPPNAFITQTPIDRANTEYWSECLVLRASYNDAQYRLAIFKMVNGQEVPVYATGWEAGPVEDFCFTTVQGTPNAHYLEALTQHRARLEVKNDCNETDVYQYDFMTPDDENTVTDPPIGFETMHIVPNPGSGLTELQFTASDDNELFACFAANNLTGTSSLVFQNYPALSGENAVQVDFSSLAPGSYTITLISARHLFLARFLKL